MKPPKPTNQTMAPPMTIRDDYESGASALRSPDVPIEVPKMSLRQHFALSAPPPPEWWRIRTPLDSARWCWAWADALLKTQAEVTTPDSAEQPRSS